jgi:hypothetical protein
LDFANHPYLCKGLYYFNYNNKGTNHAKTNKNPSSQSTKNRRSTQLEKSNFCPISDFFKPYPSRAKAGFKKSPSG